MEVKIKLTLGAIITLLLAMSGTYYISQDDDAYYCEVKDMVMICEKLSSGIGSRCYYEDTYKICKLGWEKIEIGQEVKGEILPPEIIYLDTPAYIEGIKWSCSPVRCVRIE